MSQNLMDTEPGGENTPYESIHTVTVPHKKSGGQMGHPETSVDFSPAAEAEKQAQKGEATAEKIRYGQSLSENGMGGQTSSSMGSANSGAAGASAVSEETPESEREKSGYGGDNDMDRTIGA